MKNRLTRPRGVKVYNYFVFLLKDDFNSLTKFTENVRKNRRNKHSHRAKQIANR